MLRRQFIAGLSGTALAAGADFLWIGETAAQTSAPVVPRTLVNVMLIGGADFRQVFVPAPDYDQAYIEGFWTARRALYAEAYPDYATMFAAEYQSVTDPLSGRAFGIHRSCGWLASRFGVGDVAIVSNVIGSDNRRHDHSQLIVDTGDLLAAQADTFRDGWGGRLVEAAGSDSNVVVVSDGLSLFCMGTQPVDRVAHVVHARNMRRMALPDVDETLAVTHPSNSMVRALRAYYEARGAEFHNEKPANWPYRRFFQHYRSVRTFGARIDERLSARLLPARLAALSLHNPDFAQQCRNLYDCCQASDILGCRVVSMNYDGWDSHAAQYSKLGNFLPDVFGSAGGLATVSAMLADELPGANESLVYVFNSDFGRQLAANGSLGTDHGRGNYSIIVGNAVKGGVYGEMFPAREARSEPNDSQARTPFQLPGTDIQGLTSLERVLAKTCDWIAPGAGAGVFPRAATSMLERDVDLSTLFSA